MDTLRILQRPAWNNTLLINLGRENTAKTNVFKKLISLLNTRFMGSNPSCGSVLGCGSLLGTLPVIGKIETTGLPLMPSTVGRLGKSKKIIYI